MNLSIANKAVEKFLVLDVSQISPDTINAFRMQAEMGMRYLEQQKVLDLKEEA